MLKNRKVELSTIIGRGSNITGNLTIRGGIRIDGSIEGTIKTDGFLIIGNSGRAKADLHAKECLVSGELEGDVTATEVLELDKTARVKGNITAKILTVHAGAILIGNCYTGEKKPVTGSNVVRDASQVSPKNAEKTV
jgi:cytoskeletal protein CcmA (bactofilin family)